MQDIHKPRGGQHARPTNTLTFLWHVHWNHFRLKRNNTFEPGKQEKACTTAAHSMVVLLMAIHKQKVLHITLAF